MISVFLAVLVIAAVLIIRKRKKKKKAEAERIAEREREELDRTVILGRAPAGEVEGTTFLWDREGIKGTILLTDINDRTNSYRKQIEDGAVIGKDASSCDICIRYDKTISRKHCRISRKGNEFFIRDLGSSNGTFIGSRQVHDSEVEIVSEDIIRLGQTQLKFQILN